MAFTTDQLAAVDAAIASGELRVSFNGRDVTYRSMNDLVKARQLIAAELAATADNNRAGAHRYFTFTTARGD